MKPSEPKGTVASEMVGDSRTMLGRELRRGLREVAGRYRLQRLLTALLPFLVLGTAATMVGWFLRFFSGLLPLPWLAPWFAWGGGFLFFLAPCLKAIDLERAAVLLDGRSTQADHFRSAWTFLQSSCSSGMEVLTVQSAEERLLTVDLRYLFPLKLPRAAYPLALLSLILMGHGVWLQQSLIDSFLAQSVRGDLGKQDLLKELREVVPERDAELEALLEEIESSETIEQMLDLIEEMRQRIGLGGIDEAVLASDLENLISNLSSENQFVAALRANGLEALADALRQASRDLDLGAEGLEDFLQDLPPSESMDQAQIRDILEELQGARRALERENQAEAAERLEAAAEELQQLAEQRQTHRDNRAAAQAIEGLQQRVQQEADVSVTSNQEAAEGGSLSGGGSVSAPAESPADEASSGQVAGATGDSSSPGLELELDPEVDRTMLAARFEVEFGQVRSLVREPSGKKTRDLPSLQVQAVRAPSDGRITVTQELEEPLSNTQLPWDLRQRVREYFLAINNETFDSSGN